MRPVTSTGSGAPPDAAAAAAAATPDTVGTHHSYGRLNPSQREAYLAATDQGRPLTLIQGPPGTGKTFTCLAILQRWLEQLRAADVVREQERAIQREDMLAEKVSPNPPTP